MCFSAAASFTGGLLLSATGIITLRKAKKPDRIPFAVIPLIFGIQQVSEGFLWLALESNESFIPGKVAMYIFLIIAEVIWPFWVPYALFRMEDDNEKKKILKYFVWAGLVVSVYYAAGLILFKVTPSILNYHIHYEAGYPIWLALSVFAIYIGVTIIPFYLSTVKYIKIFGSLLFAAVVVTAALYSYNLTSVWCFFAAFLSVYIYWILKKL
ncbi:MAG: hypothetical protein H6540_02850 [Bacteroidales bacterium]|nr:hypothetical protein [Bacteroidales bacterium]